MKIEWLIANVTAVGSPDIAEGAILGVILSGRCFGQFRRGTCYFGGGFGLALFWPIQAVSVVKECRNPLLSPNNSTQGRLMEIKWFFPM